MLSRVSILLPVHNAAATLAETLDSMRQQDFGDYEVIAVDDGSSDGSAEILRRYAALDSRIRIFLRPHAGLVDSLNFGLAQCRADYIARMDADDVMLPPRLGRQAAFLDRHPEIALVASRVELISDRPLRRGWELYLDWQNGCLGPEQIANNIYWEAPFVHPSVMLRREVFERLGPYRAGDFPEDYELWLRMHANGLRMAKLPEVLLHWREHANRMTHRDPRLSVDAFNRVRMRYLAADARIRQAARVVVWGAGRKTRKRLRGLLEAGVRPAAWVDIDPRKIGGRVDGAPIIEPKALTLLKPRPLVLAAVRSHGARALIEARLVEFGFRAGIDYLVVG
ncbi:MAG TPA: glycosyltransferase [Gammaproteobacteria bacterium]|nr:glycosyltransferase [Gammaproteobacteria bacterium]